MGVTAERAVRTAECVAEVDRARIMSRDEADQVVAAMRSVLERTVPDGKIAQLG